MQDKTYGKIMQGVGGLYSVRILNVSKSDPPSLLGSVVSCRARGSFRHDNISPLPGDTVILLRTENSKDDNAEFVIYEICQRRNSLIRPPIANLDFIFITMATVSPMPVLTTVDKLTCIAEFNKIEPIIVITKRELDEGYARDLQDIYEKSGFTVFSLSAAENIEISPLEEFIKEKLPSKTAAFAGASGIGKSTLLNRLFPTLSLTTSEISKKIQRGKHTTRKVELYQLSNALDCGYIADTPGFSMLDFERFDFFGKDDLPLTMREFFPYTGRCKYTKCSHTKEEGCAIIEAVKVGDIPKTRHESFCELYSVLKSKEKW